ncbi:MAG: DUF3429 domain-containing protein [Pseudomonadota bacterium]
MENGKKAGWLLALFGFLPFLTGTVIELMPYSGDIATLKAYNFKLLPLYAAVILSFLGGIRWGVALASHSTESKTATLAWSVVPSLWAWVAAYLAAPLNFFLFAVGFAAVGVWDRGLRGNPDVPIWYVEMRRVLTWLVTISMLVAAIGTNIPLIMSAF